MLWLAGLAVQTYFKLSADGIPITAEIWKTIFTLGAAPNQLLDLELTQRAQKEFKIELAAPIPNTSTQASRIPHPDAFLKHDFAFHKSLRKFQLCLYGLVTSVVSC